MVFTNDILGVTCSSQARKSQEDGRSCTERYTRARKKQFRLTMSLRSRITALSRLGVCIILPFAFGCAEASDSAPQYPLIRDSVGVRIVENNQATWDTPWQVAEEPTLTIGSVEDEAGRALYQVTGALRLEDGRIVIANHGTYQLRFYDEAGEFVSASGGRGGGPGEFMSVEGIFRYGADSLLAVDVYNHRVSYFDLDGRFGRSVRLEPNAEIPFPRALGVFSDGSLLAIRGLYVLGGTLPARAERPQQLLFRYQPDGQTAQPVGPFPGGERAVFATGRRTPTGELAVIQLGRRFGKKTAFAVAGDRFYVADNATYEIQVYSVDGRLTHLFRKRHTPLVVTDADVSALRDSVFANESDRILLRSWDNRPPPPETMPAYAPYIHIDRELNLWVREYTRVGAREWAYSVFNEGGVFLGMVPFPMGLTVLDIGRDYVLGLVRDELDVEYVQLYQLHKGR